MTIQEALTLVRSSEKTDCMVWTAGTRPLIINVNKEDLLQMLESALRMYPTNDRYEVECYIGKDFISIQEVNKP